MLWLIVILLIGSLSFVIFHRPQVKVVGAGWIPPRLDAVAPPAEDATTLRLARSAGGAVTHLDATSPDLDEGVTAPVAKQALMPDTFDFNDVFAGAKHPTDRPHV